MRSLLELLEPELVPFESLVMPEPGPVFAEPVGLVLPTPRGPAGLLLGSLLVPELIEPEDEPVVPELIESEDDPERIEPLDEPVLPELVDPDRSGEVMVVEPPAPPAGAVWPPVDGEPVPALAEPVDPPAVPVAVDCATAMLLPKASATPAARLINLGYLLMIWLPVSILK